MSNFPLNAYVSIKIAGHNDTKPPQKTQVSVSYIGGRRGIEHYSYLRTPFADVGWELGFEQIPPTTDPRYDIVHQTEKIRKVSSMAICVRSRPGEWLL